MKKTIVDLFEASVSQYPNNTFLLEKTGKKFQPTTYAQVKEQVYRLGAGLQALGVKKGDNMALLSEGRNMWIIGELAMFYAGAVNVPLSIKLEERNDLMFRLTHGDVQYIMVSATQLKKVRAIKDELPELKQIIIFDKIETYEEKEISLDYLKNEDYSKYTLNNSDISFNIGAGVTLFEHLQIHCNYNLALGKTAEIKNFDATEAMELKTSKWQLSLAYLF